MNKKTILTITTIIIASLALTVLVTRPLQIQAQTSNSIPTLAITGLVENPLNLTIDDIQAMPSATEYAVLYCVDAPGTPLQEGSWTGVSLSYLLQLANVSIGAVKVAFFAPDGYTADLTIPMAMQNNTLVAYQKDGVPLSSLQLVVPGNLGYKWITDPTQIKLVNYNFLGTTESEGYSDDATISNTVGAAPGNLPAFQSNPSSSTPNPITIPTQNSTPTPTSSSSSSHAQSASSTPFSTVSKAKLQPTTEFLIFAAVGSIIAVATAAASGLILTKRKNLKAEKKNAEPVN